MKLLFDHNIPTPLRVALEPHSISTAKEMLWSEFRNGDLMRAAELEGFEAMLTADQSIVYQQNNQNRRLALVVLDTNDWRILQSKHSLIAAALDRCQPGSYELVQLRLTQLYVLPPNSPS